MKFLISLIAVFLISVTVSARESGETEITTEDGIEVFQNEKFYLLKKNVKILSDNFSLTADNVKINFDESLYDITLLEAKGNVDFISPEYNMKGNGEKLNFNVKFEKLKIQGRDSVLINDDIKMFSDGFIDVNNSNGNFMLKGQNSKLTNNNIIIEADTIDGIFSNKLEEKEIVFLKISDKKISYVKNNDTEMFAEKINFDEKISQIELIDNVTIIRDGEEITGDYGTLDTKNNSYKIKSNNTKKVKVIIQDNE